MKIGIYLPSLGHGGAEYSALTVGTILRDHWDADVTVSCPDVEGTAPLRDLANSVGLPSIAFPIDMSRYDDVRIFHRHAEQAKKHFSSMAFNAVFLPYPWHRRGMGLIVGAATAGMPAVVKFALLPDDVALPDYSKRELVEALGRQIWFTNSHHNSVLLSQALGVPAGSIDFFHVGPVGLQQLVQQDEPPIGREAAHQRLTQELGVGSDSILIVTVGRFSEQKGYDVLLDGAKRIMDGRDDVHFLWVGVGELLEKLREMVAAEGLDDRVHFLGHRFDIRAILRGCDLFCLATRFEGGCSMAMLEAMDEGLPVVISDIPGVREVARDGENAFLFETGSPKGLSLAISRALDGQEGTRQVATAGRRTAAALSIDQMVSSTAQRLWTVANR